MLAGNAHTRDLDVGDERQALPAVVIDQGEDPKTTTAEKRVRHEVEAPALRSAPEGSPWAPACPVPACDHGAGALGGAPRDTAAVTSRGSSSAQQPVQSTITQSAALPRQLADAGSYLCIVQPRTAVAHRRSAYGQRLAGPALAHLENFLKTSHRLPLSTGRQNFFALLSLSIASSSIASASRRFSSALYSSTGRSRWAP